MWAGVDPRAELQAPALPSRLDRRGTSAVGAARATGGMPRGPRSHSVGSVRPLPPRGTGPPDPRGPAAHVLRPAEGRRSLWRAEMPRRAVHPSTGRALRAWRGETSSIRSQRRVEGAVASGARQSEVSTPPRGRRVLPVSPVGVAPISGRSSPLRGQAPLLVLLEPPT